MFAARAVQGATDLLGTPGTTAGGEKQREKEADKLLNEEMAKVWAKKAEQMRLEKEARKQLLKDVLNTRQLQIEEKCK